VTEASLPRQRRLPRAERERQMLDAAVSVFARRGYHAASMDEIAEVAGISKPMVYAYLGAKENLFAACVRREADRLLTEVVDVARGYDGSGGGMPGPSGGPAGGGATRLPAEELLWRGLRAFFAFVHEHRDGWSLLYRQARGDGGPFGTALDGLRGRVVDVVARMLADAKAGHGSERTAGTDADLRAFAHALVGAIESLAGWMVDHPEERPDAVAARLMNLVWVGFDDLLDGAVWRPRSAAEHG
jgi:AcrR family transcriptional regulator